MNAIVITARNWAIGRENQLLFHLPADMRHFREKTAGGTVIMGRRTLDTFPGGKPLAGRRNIVVSRNREFSREGAEVVHSVDEALALAGGADAESLWVVGGGSVYTAMLPLCRRAVVTRVDADAPEADTFFPNLDKLGNWQPEDQSEVLEENGLKFRFVEYVNGAI